MTKTIGKVAATEKNPTTIDEFYFWTNKQRILNPFDVVKVEHIEGSISFGVIEEISHITDSASYLSNFISSDFGDVDNEPNMHRIGMNFVKAKVLGNDKSIYTPVLDGSKVGLAEQAEVLQALGLNNIKNPLVCGYMEMYRAEDKITLPVHLNSQFLIGPEGAHLNISGISGLAAKTSYTMFLMKAIQEQYLKTDGSDDSIAFVMFNVKGRDLLAIDEPNEELTVEEKIRYTNMLGLSTEPFKNAKYHYPYSDQSTSKTYSYGQNSDIEAQIDANKGFKYKYVFEDDKLNLDLLFSNIEDSTGTMESIINFIVTDQGGFGEVTSWAQFINKVGDFTKAGQQGSDKEISVMSWRKFKRVISKALNNSIFSQRVVPEKNEIRLRDSIKDIKKNDIHVIDIAKLDQDTQAFVFGDVIRAIYDLKLGQEDRNENEIPSKIVIFIDELNKYASKDIPKDSPILRQIIDISERGRSLGIILFSVEQFKSAIHDRVKGNCATHAYGRTNAIEISKGDYRFVPPVYKNMMTRLDPGEYIIEHPVFRSLLNIKFPRPLYKQFPNG
ncbi:ATP-binding protein [Algoriphagus jejuensis]|uniref:ATP-binding protein n=1 Tax=Algoriphagus jejuensis TaxID=419934 RepID=A0ABN1N0X7_9BACT